MTRTLLNLPLEVHRAVFKHLLYPNLMRLRATCQELRQIDARDITEDALVQLEKDWFDAVLLVEETKAGRGRNTRKANILECWGYAIDDTDKLEHYLPCYECLHPRKLGAHFSSDYLSELAKHATALARSYQQPLQIPATRHCIECVLQSSKYLEDPSGRWLCVRPGPGLSRQHYWLAICDICNIRVQSFEAPLERQRQAGLCSPCFEKSYPEWFQIQHELQSRKDSLRLQVNTINQQIEVLGGCSSWMADVDNGKSVVDSRPNYLDEMTRPNWEEIRPDAVAKLPPVWGSRP